MTTKRTGQQLKQPRPHRLRLVLAVLSAFVVYSALVWRGLPLLIDPNLSGFEQTERLKNWDLSRHARGDFDGDGSEDLISFTGCAFLSAAQPDLIPLDQRCTAPGIASFVFDDSRVGQKYIRTDTSQLDLGTKIGQTRIRHAYLGKHKDALWRIYAQQSGQSLTSYQIQPDGVLSDPLPVTPLNRLDELLYSLSSLFILLALPTLPLVLLMAPVLSFFQSRELSLTPWQTWTILLVFLAAAYTSLRAWHHLSKKNAFGLTRWGLPLGIFVWGDAAVLGPFWMLCAAGALILQDWALFWLVVSLFWVVRSLGEVMYWMAEQFSTKQRNPPETLLFHTVFHDDSIWFAHQVFWQCALVLSTVATIASAAIWIGGWK